MQPLRLIPILPLFALSSILLVQSLLAQSPMDVGIAAGTGTIQGTALDSASRRPVGSAIVTAVRAGLPPVSQTATAGPTGRSSFRVCRQARILFALRRWRQGISIRASLHQCR
jgi:hypothetical protein